MPGTSGEARVCPHCDNDDWRLVETLVVKGKSAAGWRWYRCEVCSKEWREPRVQKGTQDG
jgi:formate dehydrogenase maturation protein FdhE